MTGPRRDRRRPGRDPPQRARCSSELTGTQLMTVVKADGYGHGLAESARAARDGGADWLGVATIDEALALRAAGDTGRVLCWLTVPGDDWAAAIERGRRRDRLLRRRARRHRRHRPTGAGCSSRSTPASTAAAPRSPTGPTSWPAASAAEDDGSWTSHRHLVALLLQRRAGRPGERRPGGGVPGRARPGRRAPGSSPRCGTSPTPRPRSCGRAPGSTWCASASRRTASTRRPASPRDLGLRAGDDGPRQPRHGQARRGGRRGLLRPHLDRRPRDDARAGAGRVRRRPPAVGRQPRRGPGRQAGDARSGAGSAWTSSSSTSTATTPGRARTPSCSAPATTASRRRRTGRRPAGRSATRSSPGSAAGSPGGTSTAEARETIERMSRPPPHPRGRRRCRRAGRGRRGDRHPPAEPRHRPPRRRRHAVRQPALAARSRSSPTTASPARRGRRARSRTCGSGRASSPLVFCHGYALNLDCWHFQRAAYRGLVRAVYYDQRSHGRSGRSSDGHATIEQLGHDLRTSPRRRRARGPGRPGRATRWAA